MWLVKCSLRAGLATVLLGISGLVTSASASYGPQPLSLQYWGAEEADRLEDFRTAAQAVVFRDGDGEFSASQGAAKHLEQMLALAQNSVDPNAMFDLPEFLPVLQTRPQRYDYADALTSLRRLLDFSVSLCPAEDISDSCIGRRFALARVFANSDNFEAALAILSPVTQAHPAGSDQRLAFLLAQIKNIESALAERKANASETKFAARARANLEQAELRIRDALKKNRPDLARTELIGLPPPTADDPTLQWRRMQAYVDGDHTRLRALYAIANAPTDPCNPLAFFATKPPGTELPRGGLSGCDYTPAAMAGAINRHWLQAAAWGPKDARVRQSARRFSLDFLGTLLTETDKARAQASGTVSHFLPEGDKPLVESLIALALTDSGSLARNDAQTSFRLMQELAMGPLAKQIALRTAERQAVLVDPEALPLIQEYRNINRPRLINGAAMPPSPTDRASPPRVSVSEMLRPEELAGEISRRVPRYFSDSVPRLYTLAETQKLLRPNEAMVVLRPAAFGTITFVVTSDRVGWSTGTWDQNRVQQAVTRLRWDVYGEPDIPAPVVQRWLRQAGEAESYDRKVAYALYRELFGGIEQVLSGKDSLFVVASGSLAAIPMGVLVTRPPEGADSDPAALRATAWMADRMAIAALPSIQMLDLLRNGKQPDAVRRERVSFSGFGDPTLSGVPAVRGERSASGRARQMMRTVSNARQVQSLSEMTELPGTRLELRAMQKAVDAPSTSIRLADQATEAAFRKGLDERPALLSFATHAVLPYEVRGVAEGALILTPQSGADSQNDGILRSSEVAELAIPSDWVILSACNTGAVSSLSSPFLGLPEAFLFAGAQSLLVSHWPVSDEVAPILTVRTIEISKEQRISKAHALQAAMREVRNSPDNPHWSHPAAWAPFDLIGTPN